MVNTCWLYRDDSTVSLRVSRLSVRQEKAFPVTFCSSCCWPAGARHSPEKVQRGTGVIWVGELRRVRLASGRSETNTKLCRGGRLDHALGVEVRDRVTNNS